MRHCPLCGKVSSILCTKKHHNYDILYCSDCQFQFCDPMEDLGGGFYQQCSLYENRSQDTLLLVPSYDWRFQTFHKMHVSRPDQSLLDIGCGDGGFMALAQTKGVNVFGIDIDRRATRLAKQVRNLEHVVTGRWEKLQSIESWKDFDMVTLFDVLEHVSSPVSLAATVFELLKPGGYICCTVPRLDRSPKIFDIESDYPPHHLTQWTPHALGLLLEKIGFIEIRITKKPLMIQELGLHLIWRARRSIRKIRRNEDQAECSGRAKSEPMFVKLGFVTKLAKTPIRFTLIGVNRFLRALYPRGGFTLLAMAEKPKPQVGGV